MSAATITKPVPTVDELIADIKASFKKAQSRRSEGKEGFLTLQQLPAADIPWHELKAVSYLGMVECTDCSNPASICKHNPWLNGTIQHPVYEAPVEVTPEPKKFVEKVENFTLAPQSVQPSRRGRQPRPRPVFTNAQKNDFVKMYATGVSVQAVADKFGYQLADIYEVIKESGTIRAKGSHLSARKRVFTDAEKQSYIEAYVAGATTMEVADKFKIGVNYVNEIIRESGKMRPKGSHFKGGSRTSTRTKRVFTDAEKKAFIKEYVAGNSLQAVADKFKIGVNYVNEIITESGKMRPKGSHFANRTSSKAEITPALVKQATKRYNNGETIMVIAEEANVDPAKLSQALKAAGVPVRKGRRA